MSTTLADLAKLVHGRLCGDGSLVITSAATLSVAQAGEITLVDHASKSVELAESTASAAIVSADVEVGDKTAIVVEDVHAAFALVVTHFRPRRKQRRVGVCEGAWVHPSAQLAEDVDVYPGAQIGEDVVIGRGSTIHAGVQIMSGCVLGEQVTLFPNVVLYDDTTLGDRTLVHAGAVIGSFGFGYKQVDDKHVLCAQLGFVEIGADVEIGAGTTIDRGSYGPTSIGQGTKMDNLVQIGHNCRIGRHNLICSQVGIAGSTTTGDYVVMAGQAGVRDHVHIGKGAVLGAKAGVTNSVEEGAIMYGAPATTMRVKKLQIAAVSKLPEMRRQFRVMQRQLAKMEERLADSDHDSSNDQAA